MREPIEQHNMAPVERRQSTRFRLRDVRAIMSWEEDCECIVCEGDVRNISGGGAAVLAERAPSAGLPVQVRLVCKPTTLEPLGARSLALSVDPSGGQFVRLQFAHWVSLDAILEHHLDRRLWQRFPVHGTRAKLTWLEDGSEKTVPGELVNISGGGAAVVVDVSAPGDVPVWFELECDDGGLDPVESRLVVTSPDPSGSTIARFRFIDPCPMLLFELAIHGAETAGLT